MSRDPGSSSGRPLLLLASGVAFLVLGALALTDRLPVSRAATGSAFGWEPGELVHDFAFRDADGHDGSLGLLLREHEAVVVALRTTECPVSRRYGHRLAEMERTYGEGGVAFLYLAPGAQETPEKIREDRDTYGFGAPYVADPDGKIAGLLRARVSSEVFVVDRAGTLRYRGPVDDQFGIDFSNPRVRREHLRDALDDVLEGRPIRTARAEASGCYLEHFEADVPRREVTFHSRAGRILQENCVACHREGGVAPFRLDRYEEAYGFRSMIRWAVEEGRMPPWFADPDYGQWANERRLSEGDRRDLLAWVEAGAPEGDAATAALPVRYVDGWDLEREPDAVFTIPEPQEIPAEGVLDYRYVFVKTDFDEDVWVKAVEPRPTAMEQTHHIIAYLQGPDDERRGPFFAGWAPGTGATVYPEGRAKRLPAGAWLMFELHYTPNGREAVDRSRIGFLLADGPPEREVRTSWVATFDFEIPPGAEDHVVEAELRFPTSGEIYLYLPHMHLRGKAFRYELVRADGAKEILLDVPNYDFNWQLWYEPRVPLRIEEGDVLRGIARYDNSENNPANPDSTVPVRYGEQSWDEMMFGFFDWAPDPPRGDSRE
jgi:hypothetical protein